jgi:dolichol-phosphate hexosyltransferase
MHLSILMPVYNEAATVAVAVKRVLNVDCPCSFEVVVVDDGSTDGTAHALAGLSNERLVVHRHAVNAGKGAAIRSASRLASGDYIVVCDADLEYAPEDIPTLVQPVLAGDAEVVFGSRTFGSHSAYSFWYVVGNKAITFTANALFNAWIADLETGFKLLPLQLYRELDIKSAGFGMEAEITGKLLARGVRPYEVPVTYRARGREDGKKITWRDGVEALWILSRIRATSVRSARRHRGGRQRPPTPLC